MLAADLLHVEELHAFPMPALPIHPILKSFKAIFGHCCIVCGGEARHTHKCDLELLIQKKK